MGKTAAAVKGLMVKLLMNCLWIVLAGAPGSMLAPLVVLLLAHDVDLPHKWSNRRYFHAGLFALSNTLLDKQLLRILASPWFSLLCDSSTDIAKEDHLLVYVQYVDLLYLNVHIEYLCTIKLVALGAETITNVLLQVVDCFGLDRKKLVGLCSDGASVFTGQNSGVATRLKNDLPHLISVHCVAHRCALIMGDKGNALKAHCLKRLDLIFKLVHNIFSHSATRMAQWLHFAKSLGVTLLKFPLYNATRWFSRMQCLLALTNNMYVFILWLPVVQNVAGVAALQLTLTNFKVVAMIFLLRDILEIVEVLSKELQVAKLAPRFRPTVQTAEVERGFSAERLFKHRLSSCLQILVMDSLLRVYFHGPQLDTDAALPLCSEAEAHLIENQPRQGAVVHDRVAKLYSVVTEMQESLIKRPDLNDAHDDDDIDSDEDGGFFPAKEGASDETPVMYDELFSAGYFEKLLSTCLDEADMIEFRRIKALLDA